MPVQVKERSALPCQHGLLIKKVQTKLQQSSLRRFAGTGLSMLCAQLGVSQKGQLYLRILRPQIKTHRSTGPKQILRNEHEGVTQPEIK